MSSAHRYVLLASIACLLTGAASAQESPDTNRKVTGGGISIPGWQGKIDVDATSAAIEGLDSTGNTAQSVTFIGTFPRCPDKQSTTQMAAGSSYSSCLTFLVPGGIDKVAYTGTEAYINSPVTWGVG